MRPVTRRERERQRGDEKRGRETQRGEEKRGRERPVKDSEETVLLMLQVMSFFSLLERFVTLSCTSNESGV